MDKAITHFNNINVEENQLQDEYSFSGDPNNKYLIKYNPIKYSQNLYNSITYKFFVKYAFVVKRYQKHIDSLKFVSFLITFLISAILYLLTKKIIISIILFAVLSILILIILKTISEGKSYYEFYDEYITKIISKVINDFSFMPGEKKDITREYITNNINKMFHIYSLDNLYKFDSSHSFGEIFNLKLERELESEKADGTKTIKKEMVFDGINISINYKNAFNFLKGAIIEIRDDESLFSSITEDTVHGIYQKDNEFMFNSEELNKSFDCHIKGTNSFGDIDDLMQKIHLIITPTFEEKLLFLRQRFNSFNMTITDNKINFNVSMKKSAFQKIKANEIMKFSNSYKDVIQKIEIPKGTISGYQDFMYYKIMPPIEHLFFVMYLDELIRPVLDKDTKKIENIELIKQFEREDIELSTTKFSEIKKLYKDEIEHLYNESKEIKIELKEEEIKNGKNI